VEGIIEKRKDEDENEKRLKRKEEEKKMKDKRMRRKEANALLEYHIVISVQRKATSVMTLRRKVETGLKLKRLKIHQGDDGDYTALYPRRL
jgi:hypothetical protein